MNYISKINSLFSDYDQYNQCIQTYLKNMKKLVEIYRFLMTEPLQSTPKKNEKEILVHCSLLSMHHNMMLSIDIPETCLLPLSSVSSLFLFFSQPSQSMELFHQFNFDSIQNLIQNDTMNSYTFTIPISQSSYHDSCYHFSFLFPTSLQDLFIQHNTISMSLYLITKPIQNHCISSLIHEDSLVSKESSQTLPSLPLFLLRKTLLLTDFQLLNESLSSEHINNNKLSFADTNYTRFSSSMHSRSGNAVFLLFLLLFL